MTKLNIKTDFSVSTVPVVHELEDYLGGILGDQIGDQIYLYLRNTMKDRPLLPLFMEEA